MPKLRVSIVRYLNTAPLVWGFTHGPLRGKYELSFTVPSQCAEALRSGAADVAIIPAIEYQRIPDLVILPDLAIASKERVRSLLLISKTPIRQARRIALDSGSRSTQALTRILCDRWWKIAPEIFEAPPATEEMLKDADTALVIGDVALRIAVAAESKMAPGPDGEWVCDGKTAGVSSVAKLHIYDVVKEWWHMTEKPAVLAVWAARPSVVTDALVDDFLASRNYGLQHIREICAGAAREMQLPERELRIYLESNIDYSLGEKNLEGLVAYFHYCDGLGLLGGHRLEQIAIAGNSHTHARYMNFVYKKKGASSEAPTLS